MEEEEFPQTPQRTPFRLPTWVALTVLVALILGFVYLMHWIFARGSDGGSSSTEPPSSTTPSAPPADPYYQVASVSSACASQDAGSQISVVAGDETLFVASPPAGSSGGILVTKFPSPQGIRPQDLAQYFQRTAQVRYFQDATANAQDVLTLVQFVRSSFTDGTHFFALVVDRASPNLLGNAIVAYSLRWLRLAPNSASDGAMSSVAFPSDDYANYSTDPCRTSFSLPAIGLPSLAPSPAQ
jgi:hypothetical protein